MRCCPKQNFKRAGNVAPWFKTHLAHRRHWVQSSIMKKRKHKNEVSWAERGSPLDGGMGCGEMIEKIGREQAGSTGKNMTKSAETTYDTIFYNKNTNCQQCKKYFFSGKRSVTAHAAGDTCSRDMMIWLYCQPQGQLLISPGHHTGPHLQGNVGFRKEADP